MNPTIPPVAVSLSSLIPVGAALVTSSASKLTSIVNGLWKAEMEKKSFYMSDFLSIPIDFKSFYNQF